jgi:DNA-directed RNA polymerase specialized sigma24 family protein
METRLTEQEGRCIRLHYLEGLSYAEAGECLGRDRTTVYHNVRRGIAKLRTAARLAGLIPGEPQANTALDCDPPTDI